MNKNAEYFLNKTLGNDFLESLGTALSKSEIYKPGSRTVVESSDMYQGMRLVPRVLMKLLIAELVPMQIGETKEVKLPVAEDTLLRATKHERDSISGEVIQNNVKIAEFMHRSIPGIGLVLLSALELYNVEHLEEDHKMDDSSEQKIQSIIYERMHLHSLINQVIDGKLMHRDAVQQMFIAKLNQLSAEHKEMQKPKEEPKAAPVVIVLEPKKKRPLEDFVENRKKKLAKKEFSIEIKKSEEINCPECNGILFNDSGISACLCYGSDMGRKVFLKKTEDGYKISFPKSWNEDNIEMLLDVLRSKKDGQ